ncbi:MAG TPA: polysaccharide deacetylase family protein, partial [Proteobacteria bacterium]|nr:polysaccharide deacetylase family protein [Pseudomonadota bacterium]
LVTLGSHTMSHRKINQLSEADLIYEIQESKKIVDKLQGHCETFAYPYGDSSFVTAQSESVISESGYKYAFTTTGGVLRKGTDRFRIGRSNIQGCVSLEKLYFFCRGIHPKLRFFRDRIVKNRFYNAKSPAGLIGDQISRRP